MTGKLDLNKIPFGLFNNLSDADGPSTDRRRTDPLEFLRLSTEAAYGKNALRNKEAFNGIIVDSREVNYPSFQNKQAVLDDFVTKEKSASQESKFKDYKSTVYKVYIPELEPRPAPRGIGDPIILTYPDVYSDVESDSPMEIGSLVLVRYEDVENLFNPRIVSNTGKSVGLNSFDGDVSLNKNFNNGKTGVIGSTGETGPPVPRNEQLPVLEKFQEFVYYPPGKERIELFQSVAVEVVGKLFSLPDNRRKVYIDIDGGIDQESISNMIEEQRTSLDKLLEAEAFNGWVGIPNFRYNDTYNDINNPENRAKWPEIAVKASNRVGGHWYTNNESPNDRNVILGSTATGLGQLTIGNVIEYGDKNRYYSTDPKTKAKAEAAAMLAYVIDTYGDLKQAAALHDKTGTFTHKYRNAMEQKTSKQGY
jgi:hypothetical protein